MIYSKNKIFREKDQQWRNESKIEGAQLTLKNIAKQKWDTYLKAQNNVIQEWPSILDLYKKYKSLSKRLTMKELIKDRRCPTNPEEHCVTKVGYLFKDSKQCNSRVTFSQWFKQNVKYIGETFNNESINQRSKVPN